MDPKAILDRWGRKPSFTPDLSSALNDLARLAIDRPELAGPARSLGELLRAAFHPPETTPIHQSALGKMVEVGEIAGPNFQTHPPRLDESMLASRFERLTRALGSDHEPGRSLSRAIRSRKLNISAWVNEVLAGRPETVEREICEMGLDPSLAMSLLRLTLLPSLAPIAGELDRLRPEGAWDRGDCPNCGSRPLLAESRGLEQRIYYRCGLCAAGWPGDRLGCPSCGENKSQWLHYSFVEGEQDRYRLAHCDSCRYDWKVVSTLTALSPPAIIIADLATVHLDVLAEDWRGSPS